jgi:hypothetical protein
MNPGGTMNSTHHSNYDLEQPQQRLEALVRPQPSPSLIRALQQAGQAMVRFLTNGQDPVIQKHWQRDGLVWRVYDPVTQQNQRFYSEAELRTWLEGRYYE